MSKREGKFGKGWCGGGKRITREGQEIKVKKGIERNERRDSKQEIMKNSESETEGKHIGK